MVSGHACSAVHMAALQASPAKCSLPGPSGGRRRAAQALPRPGGPHVRAPLLQVEPAVDHRAYARVLHEAVRGGNHNLARVLISGASLETLLMTDTQGRGFLHALGGVPSAASMLLQCPLLSQSHGCQYRRLHPLAGGLCNPPRSACIIVRHNSIATRVLDLGISAAEKYTPFDRQDLTSIAAV